MANTQPLNATFFAFRKREKGGALLSTTIAYIVVLLAIMGAYIWLNWPALQTAFGAYVGTIQQAAQSPATPPDPTAIMSAFAPIAGSYFLVIFAVFVLVAAYEAACLRWLVRGERGGFLGLTLGADTWRVWLGYWLWLFIFIGFYMLMTIGILVAGGGAFATMSGSKDGSAAPVAVLIAILIFLAVLALCIFVGVRLAPGAATSIIAKRFAMFDAWGATRGRFWALLGSFALLWLLYIVAILVMELVTAAMMGASLFAAMAGAGPKADPSVAFSTMLSPPMIAGTLALYLVSLVIAMMFQIAQYGVNARAVTAAAEEGKIRGVTPPQAAVFS